MTNTLNNPTSVGSIGSSETIRKTPSVAMRHLSPFEMLISKKTSLYTRPFDWTQMNLHRPTHRTYYSPSFLEWFVGFSEGDGSFIVSGKRLFFTITQKDAAFLKRLRTELGFGIVCNDTKNPEIKRFTVTRREHIKILIDLFNGNLLLKKTNRRFALWVNHYNQLTGDSIQVITRDDDHQKTKHQESLTVSLEESLLWKTSWLVGFLEAEGCFSGYLKKNTISLRFCLDQTDEIELFQQLDAVFENSGSLWIRKQGPQGTHWRYQLESSNGIQRLLKYLSGKKLRTKKNIAFVRWKKLYNLLEIVRSEKREATFVWSEKRELKMRRLLKEINQHN